MVNFSYSNLATRNEEVAKMKQENFRVARDIRLTGLAKMFVSECLLVTIPKDLAECDVRFEELENSDLYKFESFDSELFKDEAEREFLKNGYTTEVVFSDSLKDKIKLRVNAEENGQANRNMGFAIINEYGEYLYKKEESKSGYYSPCPLDMLFFDKEEEALEMNDSLIEKTMTICVFP